MPFRNIMSRRLVGAYAPGGISGHGGAVIDRPPTFLAHFDQRSRKDVISGKNGNASTTRTAGGQTPAKFTGALHNPAGALGGAGVITTYTLTSAFGTSDFTIDYWVRPTSYFENYKHIAVGTINDAGFSIETQGGGVVQVYTLASGGNLELGSSVALSVDTWAHVALTRSGNTFKLYINGVERGTATHARIGANFTATELGVGAYPSGASTQLQGQIDELRISDVVRYSGTFTPRSTAYANPSNAYPDVALDAETKALTHFTRIESDEAGRSLLTSGTGIALAEGPFPAFPDCKGMVPGTFGVRYKTFEAEMGLGSGDLTADAWVYFTGGLTSDSIVLGMYDSVGADFPNSWILSYYGPGGYWYWGDTAGGERVKLITTPSLNTWYHIAVSRQGNTWRLFIDGALVHSATSAVAVTWPGDNLPYAVGSSSVGTPAKAFPGRIAEPRVTVGLARYTAAFSRPTAPFTS